VTDRIECRHAQRRENDGGSKDQNEIDTGGGDHQLEGSGQDFFRPVRALGLEQLHAADPEEREHDDRHDNDAKPAKALEQRPPKENAAWQVVEPNQNG
jgi:hypothetical protein